MGMVLKKNRGFTFIELVTVIVVLAVISVIAIPKYIHYSTDAKIATLRSIEGSIKSMISIVHAKAMVSGLAHGAQRMTLDNGQVINLSNGYPLPEDVYKILSVSDTMVSVTSNYFTNYPVLVYYFSGAPNPANNIPPFPLPNQGKDCFVMYSTSTDNITPFAGTRIMNNNC